MTVLATLVAVVLPTLVVAAAAQEPTTATGERVNRHRRTLTGDLRYLVTRAGY